MKFLLMKLTSTLSLIVCLITPAIVNAQDKQASLQFVSFPISNDPQPVNLLIGEGKTIAVELPCNRLSPVYKVPALGTWVLGKPAVGADGKPVLGADGKPVFETFGQTPSTGSDNQVILVIRKGAEDKDGFEMVSFDSGSKGFGGGKYIFLNGAKVDIAGDIGGSKFVLKPLKHILIAPNPSEIKEDRKYLYTTLFFRKGEEAIPFYTSTWRFSEKARCMVFFYHEPHGGQLRTHTIRDYLQ